jgi:quercetin dioxygenase-like cupin family protein
MVAVALKLPLRFDAAGMQADVDAIPPEDWVEHYNQSDYEGDWRGIALRSVSGDSRNLFAGGGAGSFLDTPLLQRSPNLRGVLRAFEFEMGSVRLLTLRAGSAIREHSDPALSYEDGEVRLHIPIRTNPALEFYLDGRRLILGEGETWYMNLSLPHRVHNRGWEDRVHLVIDGKVNAWVADLFSRGVPGEAAPPPVNAFDAIRELVVRDGNLCNELLALSDRDEFVTRTVKMAAERGIQLEEGDVNHAIRSGLDAWRRRHQTL